MQRLRRNIRWMFRLLTGIGISVIYYFIFSIFFDTPIEYEIKRANEKLDAQYAVLTERYDTLQNVLNNLIERDKGIYKVLFETEPFYNDSLDVASSARSYDRLLEMSNKELGDEFVTRVGQLYQRVYGIQAKAESTAEYFEKNRDAVNAIPSIQPISNPDLTLLTASYGQRIQPFLKTMVQHNGVDFSIPIGTAVFATADGVVEQIETRGQSMGLSLKLRHEGGYQTIYGNLSRVIVTPGARVMRGDIIALSGNSGLSFAPHLHYEVRHRSRALDPTDYFFLEVDITQQDKLRKIAATGMQSFD